MKSESDKTEVRERESKGVMREERTYEKQRRVKREGEREGGREV